MGRRARRRGGPGCRRGRHLGGADRQDYKEKTSKGAWLIAHVAPWCGHCKKLSPTWAQLAAKANKSGKYTVAKVDCTVQKAVAADMGIRGFPTIKMIIDGEVHDYNGARSIEAFEEFVAGKLGVAKTEL